MGEYDSILHLEHHVSAVHPQMSLTDRAAQFSPFAALSGYEDELREAARATEERRELSEDEAAELNRRLAELMARDAGRREAEVTWFVPDEKKQGGRYVTETVRIRACDPVLRQLVLEDRRVIPLADLIRVEG